MYINSKTCSRFSDRIFLFGFRISSIFLPDFQKISAVFYSNVSIDSIYVFGFSGFFRMFPGCFPDVSRMLPECFSDVSWMFPGCFPDVSPYFFLDFFQEFSDNKLFSYLFIVSYKVLLSQHGELKLRIVRARSVCVYTVYGYIASRHKGGRKLVIRMIK